MFVAAAESGSFTKAGRSLYTSHSTVSRAVTALEKELEVPLIIRSNRMLGLTAAGEMLLREGRRLLAEVEGLGDRLKAARDEAEPDPGDKEK